MVDQGATVAPPPPPSPPPPPPGPRGASAAGPGRVGPSSSLAFGSRGLAIAVGGLLLAAVMVAGVLGYRDHRDDGPTNTRTVDTNAPAASAPATSAPVQAEAATKCQQPNAIPAAAGKPTKIPMPDKPVTSLTVRDLKVGTGRAAADGSKLTLQYVGLSCTSGKQIDSSWDRNEPLPVTLGSGTVIPGWDQGIKGMKVGGRRLLWIPAALAYGAEGRPPEVAPGDTLVFIIDLVKIG